MIDWKDPSIWEGLEDKLRDNKVRPFRDEYEMKFPEPEYNNKYEKIYNIQKTFINNFKNNISLDINSLYPDLKTGLGKSRFFVPVNAETVLAAVMTSSFVDVPTGAMGSVEEIDLSKPGYFVIKQSRLLILFIQDYQEYPPEDTKVLPYPVFMFRDRNAAIQHMFNAKMKSEEDLTIQVVVNGETLSGEKSKKYLKFS